LGLSIEARIWSHRAGFRSLVTAGALGSCQS
jgi:hypothetical protein